MAAEWRFPRKTWHNIARAGCEAGRILSDIVPMIRIHSAKTAPADSFVRVRYRDTWFWIGDGDLASKRTFAQLMNLIHNDRHWRKRESAGGYDTVALTSQWCRSVSNEKRAVKAQK